MIARATLCDTLVMTKNGADSTLQGSEASNGCAVQRWWTREHGAAATGGHLLTDFYRQIVLWLVLVLQGCTPMDVAQNIIDNAEYAGRNIRRVPERGSIENSF